MWLISISVGIFVSSLINQHWVPLFWVRLGQPATGVRILRTTYHMSRKSFLGHYFFGLGSVRAQKLFQWLACVISLKNIFRENICGNFYSHKDYINIIFVNIPVRFLWKYLWKYWKITNIVTNILYNIATHICQHKYWWQYL